MVPLRMPGVGGSGARANRARARVCRKWKRDAMVQSARYAKNGITPFSGNYCAFPGAIEGDADAG
jgi:hypothetical protein